MLLFTFSLSLRSFAYYGSTGKKKILKSVSDTLTRESKNVVSRIVFLRALGHKQAKDLDSVVRVYPTSEGAGQSNLVLEVHQIKPPLVLMTLIQLGPCTLILGCFMPFFFPRGVVFSFSALWPKFSSKCTSPGKPRRVTSLDSFFMLNSVSLCSFLSWLGLALSLRTTMLLRIR